MCVSGFSSEKTRTLSFYSIKIFCMDTAFFYYILAYFTAYVTIFWWQFTIKCLGSGQKPRYGWETWNTQISFWPNYRKNLNSKYVILLNCNKVIIIIIIRRENKTVITQEDVVYFWKPILLSLLLLYIAQQDDWCVYTRMSDKLSSFAYSFGKCVGTHSLLKNWHNCT